MNLSSFCSVPTTTEVVNTCPECWLDTGAVVNFFGREICPECARSEEAAYEEAQIRAYEAAEFGRHDQMSHIGSVLQGMGF